MPTKKEKLEYIKRTFELQKLVESLVLDYIEINSTYDISELKQTLSIIYLPASVQPQFEKFADNKIKLFKIVNLGSPAIRIKYNLKHQYSIEQYVTGEKKNKSDNDINDLKLWWIYLENKIKKIEIDDIERIQEIKEDIRYIQKVLTNLDKYEVIESSFLKGYQYTMCNYQYVGNDVKQFRSVQLVGSEARYYNEKLEKVGERQKTNIIFLDEYKIKRRTRKTTEKISAYLKSFDRKIVGARRDLFIKRKQ